MNIRYARRQLRTLLNMGGGGGGKNAHNLQRDFAVTGIDISPAMLAQARQLNGDRRRSLFARRRADLVCTGGSTSAAFIIPLDKVEELFRQATEESHRFFAGGLNR